ncbi:MAG: hypothetical protein JWN32_3773 [Solirubrobacterales bacterium]|nr:hypothetical protein [Solirubrobacterales bacterium]
MAIPTLEQAIALAERTLNGLADDALAVEAEAAADTLREVQGAAIAARSEAAHLEAVQHHAENRLRAAANEARRRAMATPRACEVPGCPSPARSRFRTCAKHVLGDIAAAA